MCTRSLWVGVPNPCEYRREYAPERVWTFPRSCRRHRAERWVCRRDGKVARDGRDHGVEAPCISLSRNNEKGLYDWVERWSRDVPEGTYRSCWPTGTETWNRSNESFPCESRLPCGRVVRRSYDLWRMHPEDLEGPRNLGHQRMRKHLHVLVSVFPIDTPKFWLPWNLDYAVSRVWPACNGTRRQSTYRRGSGGIWCDWNSRPDNHAKSSLGTRRQCWFSHGICLPCTENEETGTCQNCLHVGCNRLHPVTGIIASGAIPGRRENDWCSSTSRRAVCWRSCQLPCGSDGDPSCKQRQWWCGKRDWSKPEAQIRTWRRDTPAWGVWCQICSIQSSPFGSRRWRWPHIVEYATPQVYTCVYIVYTWEFQFVHQTWALLGSVHLRVSVVHQTC